MLRYIYKYLKKYLYIFKNINRIILLYDDISILFLTQLKL